MQHEDGRLEWNCGEHGTIAGAPNAFHPLDSSRVKALGKTAEQRYMGFPNVVRDGDELVMQGASDPYPGYLVSKTAYRHPGKKRTDPSAYLNSLTVPYAAIPLRLMLTMAKADPLVIGARCIVRNLAKNQSIECVAGDVEINSIGAISLCAKKMLWCCGNEDNGTPVGFQFILFPGQAARGYELQRWEP
jgi:hypothetical protein